MSENSGISELPATGSFSNHGQTHLSPPAVPLRGSAGRAQIGSSNLRRNFHSTNQRVLRPLDRHKELVLLWWKTLISITGN